MSSSGSSAQSAWAAARWGVRRTKPSYVDGALGRCRCILSSGMVQPMSRQGRVRSPAACRQSCYDDAPMVMSNSSPEPEPEPELEHGMHHDRELPRHGDGGTLKADAFAKLQAPVSQRTLSRAAGQDDAGRFVQEISYLVIATPGDMSIVVLLTCWVPSGGQPVPGTDVS